MTEWAPMLDGVCELGRESCQRRIAAAIEQARREGHDAGIRDGMEKAREIALSCEVTLTARDPFGNGQIDAALKAWIDALAVPKASERGEG